MDKEKRKASFLKLEKLAIEKGITLYALSNQLGFTRSLFSDWKSGKSMPKTDKLLKLSQFFGVSIDYFLFIGDKNE